MVFVADVTEREEHRDDLFITEHPIESGAAISDHAYKRPAELQMRIGFSNSTRQDPLAVEQIYHDLLKFQSDRTPFDVFTGKRNYANMLLAGMIVETDAANEHALRVDLHLRQVFLVNTQTFAVSTDPGSVASPGDATPTIDSGSRSVGPAANVNAKAYGNLVPGGTVTSLGTIPISQPQPLFVGTASGPAEALNKAGF